MNNIIFKINNLIYFRLAGLTNRNNAVAIVVNEFDNTPRGIKALDLYNKYLSEGKKVYILSAFNKAPLGKYLQDIRHIFIFNNNPENLVAFCKKHNIGMLHYCDYHIMIRAATQFGLDVVYSACGENTIENLITDYPRISAAKELYFYNKDLYLQFVQTTGCKNAVLNT